MKIVMCSYGKFDENILQELILYLAEYCSQSVLLATCIKIHKAHGFHELLESSNFSSSLEQCIFQCMFVQFGGYLEFSGFCLNYTTNCEGGSHFSLANHLHLLHQ